MALARVKTWNPGDTLTAADLNAEFNNIINNPTSLINLSAAGDIAIVSSAATVTRLAIGTANQALTVSTGLLPTWTANSPAMSGVRGLTGTATSSQVVTLSADRYALQTTAATPLFFSLNSTATFTVNVASSTTLGAGGRDVATAFSSTFLHIYGITTGSGSTTPAGIGSTLPPPTGPVLPTSYSAWTYLTSLLYSSATTSFVTGHRVRGDEVHYESAQNILSAGVSTTEATISMGNQLPAIALTVKSRLSATQTSSASVTASIRLASGSTYFIVPLDQGAATVTVDFQFPNIAQQLIYLWNAAPGAGGGLTMDVIGYKVPNLG